MTRQTIAATILFAALIVAAATAFSPATRFPAHGMPHSSTCTVLGAAESAAEPNNKLSLGRLDEALGANSDASQQMLRDLAALRQGNQQLEAEAYLDDLLREIDENTRAFWTRLPAVTRFSRRARRASLARALELSTPPADGDDASGDADDSESKSRRRRRALAVLLRTLSNETEERDSDSASTGRGLRVFAQPAIRRIEKAALRGAKESATLADMENRIPKGLETPKYEVVARGKAGYEVRQYEPYSLATVAMSSKIQANDPSRSATDQKVSQPTLSGASSFGALAGYLFGKNADQSSMAMTSPVFTTNAGGSGAKEEGTGREMSFVLPSNYWTDDGITVAPQPLDGSGVTLQRNEGGTRAVIMFGGYASKSDIAKRTEKLLQSVEADQDYSVLEGSTATLAQYNDPFTPGWKRRNEVSIDVVPTK